MNASALMIYNEIKPHPELAKYIDSYWTVSYNEIFQATNKVLPDGCVDIIFNLGTDLLIDNKSTLMQNEKAYLVGTMTHYKESELKPETQLLGIRFKPAGFSVFYKFDSLKEVTDSTIEFEKRLSPDLQKTIQYSTAYLNHFFLNKLSIPKHNIFPVVADIQNNKGQITVQSLSKYHYTTSRQLERAFKKYLGISPKEYINLVRYQFALVSIKNKTSKESLLSIAFDCGYYDHSHLTNEFKRYTGEVPSLF